MTANQVLGLQAASSFSSYWPLSVSSRYQTCNLWQISFGDDVMEPPPPQFRLGGSTVDGEASHCTGKTSQATYQRKKRQA